LRTGTAVLAGADVTQDAYGVFESCEEPNQQFYTMSTDSWVSGLRAMNSAGI
jgi:hypothetical protein